MNKAREYSILCVQDSDSPNKVVKTFLTYSRLHFNLVGIREFWSDPDFEMRSDSDPGKTQLNPKPYNKHINQI